MKLQNKYQLQSGRYIIDECIGQGGFGITYIATQMSLNRKVAIKEFFMKSFSSREDETSHVTLSSEGSKDLVELYYNKFLKEARALAKLNHPHIVKVIDVFEENGTAYYVMEYINGGSLSAYLNNNMGISLNLALTYIRQVADALKYVHSLGMNHLDVKPGNIMLDNQGHALLIDFGLAKQYDSDGNQTSSTPLGISEGYAPIEQYRKGGVGAFSPTTDIYSLGATLFKLVTNETPPEASIVSEEGLPALPPTCPQTIAKTIEKAMQPRRADRPQNIDEFLSLLNGEVIGEPKKKDNEETIIGDGKEKRKNKWIVGTAIVLAILVGLYFIGKDDSSIPQNIIVENIDSVQVNEIQKDSLKSNTISSPAMAEVKPKPATNTEQAEEIKPEKEIKVKEETPKTPQKTKGKKTFEDGGKYEGDLVEGKAHGYGKCIQDDGTTLEGEWKNDVPNGQVTITYYNGDKYTGRTKGEDNLNGEGTYYTKEGIVYKGTFVEGVMRNGVITNTNDSQWKYEGELNEKGEYHGFGTLVDANGTYIGTWEEGDRKKGRMTLTDGSKYDGEWKNNGPHGYGTFSYADGGVYQGYYQDGLKHGTGTLKGADGVTFSGEWRYDKEYTGTISGTQDTPFGRGDATISLKEGMPSGTVYMTIDGASLVGNLSGSGFDGDYTLTKDGQMVGFKVRNGQLIQE